MSSPTVEPRITPWSGTVSDLLLSLRRVARVVVPGLALALCGASPLTAQAAGYPTSPFDYAAPEDVGLSPGAVGELPVRLAEWVRDGELVGAEVVLIRDRRIVLHDVVGWSDREGGVPLERNAVYHVASMTKPFTGTAALMLADEGRLELDRPVAAWLPSWDTPASREVTVRQLLTHTAGWANEGPGPSTPLAELPGVRALADRVGSDGPMYAPGEAFRYGDAHSYTLAALVEAASGMPAGAFIQQRILDPLGLTDTRPVFASEAPWSSRVIPTYRRDGGAWVQYWNRADGARVPYFFGAGGMYSTALDYARWLDAWMHWLDDDDEAVPRLVSPERARAAVTPGELHPAHGMHWFVYGTDPLVFGHGGADGTRAYAVPAEGVILVLFTQSRQPVVREEWSALLERVIPGLGLGSGLPEVSAADLGEAMVDLDPSERGRFVGTYALGSDTMTVSVRDGRLRLRTGFWPPYDLVHLGDDVFAMGVYEGGELVRIAGPRARIHFVPTGDRAHALRLVLLPEGRVDFEAPRIR